jgi:hypothetical protein
MPDKGCLANLAWAGNYLDESACLAQPTSQNSSLGSGEAHGGLYVLLNTLSIFTQDIEQMQGAGL